MLGQLRNLSNPPATFGSHETAVWGLAVITTLLMFVGPVLWAVVYLLTERQQRAKGAPHLIYSGQPGESQQEAETKAEIKERKAA